MKSLFPVRRLLAGVVLACGLATATLLGLLR